MLNCNLILLRIDIIIVSALIFIARKNYTNFTKKIRKWLIYMKTIAVIAEFNPFHNGHAYLINECKNALNADYCISIMSGDFVQRGAPAVTSKFDRAKMALLSGVDLCLEMPIYYSVGSAEYFAKGSVSILDKLGSVDYLCFGSECGDIDVLTKIADVLKDEPESYKETLAKELKSGKNFALARQEALIKALDSEDTEYIKEVISNPNNILAIEYIKALKEFNSDIKPFTVKRKGKAHHESASEIRDALSKKSSLDNLKASIPEASYNILKTYDDGFADANAFSNLLYSKIIQNKDNESLEKYLDISKDLSNKIFKNLDSFTDFDSFCELLKSKDLTYTRISRSLMHIALEITSENMDEYRNDGFTAYARVLGLKKDSSAVLSKIHDNAKIPVIDRLKDSKKLLDSLQMRLLTETLNASSLYSMNFKGKAVNEFLLKSLIV